MSDIWTPNRPYNPASIIIPKSINAAQDTANLTAALAALPSIGGSIGGSIQFGSGAYTFDKPFVVPDRTVLRGLSGAGDPIFFPSANFPTAVVSGAQVFPIATLNLVSIPVNAPASGVVSVVTENGPQWVTYTGLGVNSLTGCVSVTGAGTIADASAVGWPLFMLGNPVGNSSGVFGCRIENIQIYLSTSAVRTTFVPGMMGVYSNRAQEFSGLREVGIINVSRCGWVIEPKPTGDAGITAQNWNCEHVYHQHAGLASEATGRAFSIHGGQQPQRSVRGITVTGPVQATAGFIGCYASGYYGKLSEAQIEDVTTCFYLDNTGAAATRNGPITLENIFGGNGVTTVIRNTTTAGYDQPYAFRNIEKVNGATNLIVDDVFGTTYTGNKLCKYEVGALFSGYRNINSDLYSEDDPARRFQNVLGWTIDPVAASGQVLVPAVATLYLCKIPLLRNISVTNIVLNIATIGGGTLTHSYALLYDSAGTVIGQSADQSADWGSAGATGVKTLALVGGPFAVVPKNPSDFVWAALYIGTNSAGALPKFSAGGGVGANFLNMTLGTAALRNGSKAVADTSTPGNFAPAGLTAAFFPFCALLS